METTINNIQTQSVDDGAAEIRVGLGLAEVEPAHEDLLRPLLSYDSVTFSAGRDGQLGRCKNRIPAYRRQSGNSLLIAAGCVGRVQERLERAGVRVVVRDFRRFDAARHSIDDGYLRDAESSFPGLAAVVDPCTQGVLEVSRGARRGHVTGALCRLLPKARFFIASAKRESSSSLAAQLGLYVGGEAAAVHGGNWASGRRVVCGTFTSFDNNQASDWDVLVFEDAREALGKKTLDNRANYQAHRIYAFSDPHDLRSEKDRLRFEVLAGPVIYRHSSGDAPRPSSMDVLLASYSSPSWRSSDDPRERKIELWNHKHRNHAIANVARAFADGDAAVLWSHGMFLDDSDGSIESPTARNVMVVVESPQHAELLGGLLPDWRLLNAGNTATLASRTWGVPPNSIITAVAAAQYKQFNARVLIMASGGSWPQIPTGAGPTRAPRLIVDFLDENDDALAAETQQRLSAYRNLGCRIHGVRQDDAPTAIGAGARTRKPRNARRSSRRRRPNTSRRQSRSHRR